MKNLSLARTRSVDNLQRLYTFVVGLSVTESLRRVFISMTDNGQVQSTDSWLMITSFFITVVPFYHGANRYLDATYVTEERKANQFGLMVDFLFLFIEGIALFILAMFINQRIWFFTILGFLFVFDVIWVGVTRLLARGEGEATSRYWKWATINIITALAVFVSIYSNLLKWEFWTTETATNCALLGITIFRTAYDYYSVWDFYYPPDNANVYDNIPAPRPAFPPQVSQSDHNEVSK